MRLLLLICVLSFISSKNIYAQYLQGRFVNGKEPARGIRIMLVPRNNTTEKLLSSNMWYGDNPEELKKLSAVVTITDNDGNYYFDKIKEGRYLLKVCDAYGTLYPFKIQTSDYKVLNIKQLPAFYN